MLRLGLCGYALGLLLISNCLAEDWRDVLAKDLPRMGHRNWIVIADSAYPWHSSDGIQTLVTGADQMTVVKEVLEALGQSRHVRPRVYLDAELSRVPDAEAPGATKYRDELQKALQNLAPKSLPHEQIMAKLDEASKTFRVLLLKTDMAVPYTSVFIQLDCGYWSDESEQRLRKALEAKPAPAPKSSDAAPFFLKDARLRYPQPRRGDQVDNFFGVSVADPFRWLEDADKAETKAWIQAENELTFAWLAEVPQRPAIGKRLKRLWDYEKFGVPTQRGGTFLFTRNNGLQNQSVVYVASAWDAEPRELLDPNALSADGTVALTGMSLSDDGKLLAYGASVAGSDWQQWKVREVASGKDRDDLLRWVKFSGASWAADGSGFYYSRFDEPKEAELLTALNYHQKLFFHKLGEPQAQDQLVFERPDKKEWGFNGHVTDDGHYLIVTIHRGTERKNQIFYRDLKQPDAKMLELVTGWDACYGFIDNDGPVFWFLTDNDAPRKRVIAIDTRRPRRAEWQELIPQGEAVLEDVSAVGERLLANYVRDAHSELRIFDLAGKPLGDIPLPGIGTAAGFSGRRDDRQTFYGFTSFTAPTAIFRYDVAKNESLLFRAPQVDFQPERYETRRVVYASRDGTRVPMFITAKKGVALDGLNPTLLHGYGGFDVSLTPSFSVGRIVWLEMGGVYAVANLRGGGEYGRAWHEAGMKEHKQNVFDDFIAAAEYLIAKKYTTPARLAISGGSNGGLLVGACLTQRPELFGAALPKVGVMDMLRFQKFTIGWGWINEYGTADREPDFRWLSKYSPLHNVKPGLAYPATWIETGDHDDRVAPAHSFKFAATLQAAQSGPAPILIRIETSAGHGAGTPTSKLIDAATDSYAFLAKIFEMKAP